MAGGRLWLCVFSAFCICLASPASYKATSVKSDKDFMFIGKFCFGVDQDVSDGKYPWVSFTASTDIEGQFFVLYDDEDKSWPSVYHNSSLSCPERQEKSKAISSEGSKDRGWSITPGDRHVEEKITVRERLRPRFWFAALLNCNGAGIDIDSYDLEFRNHDESQFGVEVYGMLPTFSFFFCVFCAGQALLFWGVKQYKQTATLHPMLTLLVMAGQSEFVAITAMLIHFGLYDVNGVGSSWCTALHEAGDDAFNLFFLMLVMLIAQGWTITFPTIQEKKPVLGMLAGLSAMFLVLFGWERWGRDPGLTTFRFQSIAGYLILAVRIGCAGYFGHSLRGTYKTENRPDKQGFYTKFAVTFGLWLISTPVVVTVGLILDPWVRFKWVEGLLLACNSFGLAAMAYLLWPTRVNEYFQLETGTTAQLAGSAAYDEI